MVGPAPTSCRRQDGLFGRSRERARSRQTLGVGKTEPFRTGLPPGRTFILPFKLHDWLREDRPPRAPAELVDRLDTLPILDAHQDLRRDPPCDPRAERRGAIRPPETTAGATLRPTPPPCPTIRG